LRDIILQPIRAPISFALGTAGLAGLPDDVATWQRWIDRITQDERFRRLGEEAAEAAIWFNQPVIRATLVLVGIALLLWRIPWFWRLRHKVIFQGKRVLADQVWINREKAIQLLWNSEWGQMKKPRSSAFEFHSALTGVESQSERRLKKFRLYLRKTLDSFAEDNPSFVRPAENGIEYDQAALEKFLEHAVNAELFDEFGRIPSGSILDD